MVKDRGTNEEHLAGSRARPTHPCSSESSLELFNATFNRARTNGITLFTKLLILHPSLMNVEIMGVFREMSVLKGIGKGGRRTVKQIVEGCRVPAFETGGVIGKESRSGLR